MVVFIISKNGERLMPTRRLGKVRHLLKDEKAIIVSRKPFTIQLTYDTTNHTQPIELCMDTGHQHIGLSMKSERQEYVSAQFDLLQSEKENHDAQRKYRRSRRNHLRYRKCRFDNRRIPDVWLAPSIQHKADIHIDLIKRYCAAAPVSKIIFEMGQFDTQLLQALEEGLPIPEGVDYQRGPQYLIDTVREAVFQRDHYKCVFCGRGIKDGAILHAHHLYFWRGQHGDRISEQSTVCEKCHTAANHKEGGKLWGYDKKLPQYQGSAFMNTVRWYIFNKIKDLNLADMRITYGAATKRTRLSLGLEKSHSTDAYCMGDYRPEQRADEECYIKQRRNNRILEKFYDAKTVDIRTGEVVSGSSLGCERTNRREPRVCEKSLRQYRGEKKSKGRRSIRKQHYALRPGDVVLFKGERQIVKGMHCCGSSIMLQNGKSVSIKKAKILYHVNAWRKETKDTRKAVNPQFLPTSKDGDILAVV